MTDVPQEYGGAVLVGYRNIVERLDGRRHRIGADGVIGLADFLVAAGRRQVLRVDCIDDVQWCEAFGQQLYRSTMIRRYLPPVGVGSVTPWIGANIRRNR
jgi:hypothetical protein